MSLYRLKCDCAPAEPLREQHFNREIKDVHHSSNLVKERRMTCIARFKQFSRYCDNIMKPPNAANLVRKIKVPLHVKYSETSN